MTKYVSPVFQINNADGKPIVGAKKYLFEPGTSTLKSIYSDAALTLPIDNPVESNEFGEFPDIYLDGLYREVQHDNEGVLRWDSDVGSLVTGQFQLWSIAETYNIPDIVYGSDDEFYRSLTDSNIANNPTVSPAAWEVIKFIQVWNTNVTYALSQHVYGPDGTLYFSRLASNFGNDPTSNPDDWGSVAGNVPIVTAGSATVYTAIFGITAYETNRVYEARIHTDNTGAATINFDSLGAKDIKLIDGNDPESGQVTGISRFWYDGTDMVLLNPSIGSIAGYVSGITEYIEDDVGADSISFDVDAVIGAAWESIGPTGAGADNTWTALDSVPLSAKWIEIIAYNFCSDSASANIFQNLYIRKTGSSASASIATSIATVSMHATGATQISGVGTETRKVPIDSLGRFDAYFQADGTTQVASFRLAGWGI